MNILEAARLGQGMGRSSAPMGITGSNMALRNLQVPQIGNTINAQPARLQEIDKIKYQEQMKENLRQQQFNALNSAMAEDRAFADSLALNDQTHAQRLAEEDLRYKNVLAAQKAASAKTLETEREKLKIDEDRYRMETRLADEKYKNLRGSTNKIFNDYENWITVGKKQYIENRESQLLAELAIRQGVTPEQVQAMYQSTGAQFGYTPGATITRATNPQLYDKLAVQVLLRSQQDNPDVSRIRAAVVAEAEQISQRKAVLYKVASDQVTKLGFSVAGATENIPLTSGENTNRPKITGESLNGVNLADLANGKTGGDVDPDEEKPTYIVGNLVGKGVDSLKGAADYISEDPARAAKLGLATGGSAYILEQLTKMSPSKLSKIQEEINADLKAQSSVSDTKTTKSGEPKKLNPSAAKQKAKRIAPDVMKSHAQKLLSEKEFSKLDFDKMNTDDFSKVIQKSKGGLITKMKNLGIKMIPTENGKISIDKLKENRFLKGGLYLTILGGALDTVTWANLPDSKEKKEIEETIDTLSDATQSLIDAKNAEIEELKAQLGQASPLRP